MEETRRRRRRRKQRRMKEEERAKTSPDWVVAFVFSSCLVFVWACRSVEKGNKKMGGL